MDTPDATRSPIHASCIAFRNQGLLILGKSGAGKSGLALQLVAYGAELVADDRVNLTRNGDSLTAECPQQLLNKIEARGIGLLNIVSHGPCLLKAAVSLDHLETERIPPARYIELLDVALPLLHNVDTPSFPAAILQYLQGGTHDGAPK